jgi:hypothetical protein
MIRRIKFQKGEQRKFIQEVLKRINCPSLKELGNRLDINYSTLKNYYIEERSISDELFNSLIRLSGLSKNNFNVEIISEHWGQIKGGKISKRK